VSTENVFAGSIFETNSNALNRLSLGSRTKLKNIPFGMPIHSLGL
jgi:ribosomal protein L2